MFKIYLFAAMLGTCTMIKGQTMQPSSQSFQGVFYGDLATGDINGDGTQDFLISGAKPGFSGFSQVYYSENGEFSELTLLDFDQLIYSSVAIADIDGDEINDILISGTKTDSNPQQTVFQIFKATGFGVFTKLPDTGISGVNNGSIQVADFNGDGRKDILVNGNASQPITKVYFQQADGSFIDSNQELTGTFYSATKVFDANGDGHQDILITGFNSGAIHTKLYINSGLGEFTETASGLPNVYFSSIDAADFNNDGHTDLLISGMDMTPTYTLEIFINDGQGQFTALQTDFLGTATGTAKFVDYDNDGDLDVFSMGTTLSEGNKAQIYINNGDETFTIDTAFSDTVTALNMAKAAWFDYNDDENIDLVTIGYDGTTAQTKLYTNFNPNNCSEPGENPGDTGCVTFTYQGETVTYTTVRGEDGNIWLQQNLGSTKVAETINDEPSYGDMFQWGRWDDGHQKRVSTTTSTPTPNNPLGIAEGSENYYTGTWWSPNNQNDKWEAQTPADATDVNGCDPCKALGQGWKIPTETEWIEIVDLENIGNPATALASNLKLPGTGYRSNTTGNFTFVGQRGYFWSSTPSSTGGKYLYVGSVSANPSAGAPRGQGAALRCMKYPTVTEYCNVSVDEEVEPITLVNFADLDNPSLEGVGATPAYEDFTLFSATVARGETYTLTVKGNTAGNFTHDIRVFMDWNQNKIFDMATEYYHISLEPSTGIDNVEATIDIEIPTNATLGNTRMRIIKDQWNIYEEGEFDACLNAYYGQIEDYTLSIQESLGRDNFSKNNLRIYPNPTADILNIQTDLAIESISVYNQLGQLVKNQKNQVIDLTNVPNGLYILQIKFEDGQTATQKIIKK